MLCLDNVKRKNMNFNSRYLQNSDTHGIDVAEWLRRLTCKPKVRTAVGSNPTLDSLVAIRNTSLG